MMKSLVLKLRWFLISESGSTAVKYAVMLALIVLRGDWGQVLTINY
jgi:Flp pilus assembly pilin Flp